MALGSPRLRGSPAGPLLPLLLPLLQLPVPAETSRGGDPGEPVTPRWIWDGQAGRIVTTGKPVWRLDSGLVAVKAEGQELLVELEKSRLLAPGYTETHYSSDGQPVVLAPRHKDHCHYHGRVRGFPGSWVVLSTCSEMRGLITLRNNASFYLHPWPAGNSELSTHRIFRTQQLLSWKGACGHGDLENKENMASLPRDTLTRARREVHQRRRYLELYLVADHTLFLAQNRDLNRTKQRLLEIANNVDQILRTLDIQVALTGLEVWTERDLSPVTLDANATLWAFLQWRRGLWARRPHDSAQLLTGRSFQGSTIGLAPVEGMCGAQTSGGVSTDHSALPTGAAATVAHEIGHSLGLDHDHDGCCAEASDEQGGCVMAASTGRPFPRVFSACSRRQLRAFYRKGGGACLANAPDSDPGLPATPARCGNGIVEEGEECDCGPDQECQDPCCLAHNCSRRVGAQCTHGNCCAGCLLKPAGTLCRQVAGDCDLPEFCNGTSPYCPRDMHLLDGSPCASGHGYCWDGACPTLEQQCQQLWGAGSSPALLACFHSVNSAGDARGNCGRSGSGGFTPCEQRDVLCGKLQCQGGEPSPLLPYVVPANATLHLGDWEVTCRSALMLSGAQLAFSDLGMVESGTACGPRMVCQDSRCQNDTFQELEHCLASCHGHGVCNSLGHCHCAPGWAPPYCDKPGFGGSVDSGPMQPENASGSCFLLAVSLNFLLPVLTGVGLTWCCCHPGSRLQHCLCSSKRAPTSSRPKDGPCGAHTQPGACIMELASTTAQELDSQAGPQATNLTL